MVEKEFELFCEKRYEELRNYVKRHVEPRLVEEVTQEVFATACENLEKLLNSDKPMGWLVNTAKNKMKEAWRKEQRESCISLEQCREVPVGRLSDYGMIEMDMILRELLEPRELRLLFEYYVNGRSALELAALEGIKEGTMRMRLYRLQKSLEKHLIEQNVRLARNDLGVKLEK